MSEITPPPADPSPAVTLSFEPEELAMLVVALRFLRSTLGHDEADELAVVQRLLDKVTAAA